VQYQIAKLFVEMLNRELQNPSNGVGYKAECMLVKAAVIRLMRYM